MLRCQIRKIGVKSPFSVVRIIGPLGPVLPWAAEAPPRDASIPSRNVHVSLRNTRVPAWILQVPSQNVHAPNRNVAAPVRCVSAPDGDAGAPHRNISAPGWNVRVPARNAHVRGQNPRFSVNFAYYGALRPTAEMHGAGLGTAIQQGRSMLGTRPRGRERGSVATLGMINPNSQISTTVACGRHVLICG